MKNARVTSSRPNGKKSIKVNLALQILEAFEGATRVFRFECVTGDSEHPTDSGLFWIGQKSPRYTSQAYGVPMNYAMFFTADGKAIHQYHGLLPLSAVRTARKHVSDWFGSHGCVRLAEADAKVLYAWTPPGTRVHVQ